LDVTLVRLVGAWRCKGRNVPWRYDRRAHNGTSSACYRPRSIVRPWGSAAPGHGVACLGHPTRCARGTREEQYTRGDATTDCGVREGARKERRARCATTRPGQTKGQQPGRVMSVIPPTVSSYTTLPRRALQRFCVAPHVRPPAFLSTRAKQKAPCGVVSTTTTEGAQVERDVDANVYCRTCPKYPRD